MLEQDNNISTDKVNIASAAEKGDPNAQFLLGWYYYIGYGVPRDRSLAIKWYERAANKGLPEAKRLLELLPTKPDKPTITDMVIKGWPNARWWKSTRAVLLTALALVIITSISYYMLRKNWPPLNRIVVDIADSNQQMLIKNETQPNTDTTTISLDNTTPEHLVLDEAVPDKPEVTTKGSNSIVETIEQKTAIDNKSVGKDPNSVSLSRSKSVFEEFAEIAEKWLLESPNAVD